MIWTFALLEVDRCRVLTEKELDWLDDENCRPPPLFSELIELLELLELPELALGKVPFMHLLCRR